MFGGLLILLLGIAVSILVPLVAPALGAAFVVGGAVAYRQSTDVTMRTLAAAAIAAGAVIVLASVLVGLGLVSVRVDASVSDGVPTAIPKP